MKVFAKFDEIPLTALQDIKETKRYGHTFVRSFVRTDNVKTVYPPTNTVCGGYKNKVPYILTKSTKSLEPLKLAFHRTQMENLAKLGHTEREKSLYSTTILLLVGMQLKTIVNLNHGKVLRRFARCSLIFNCSNRHTVFIDR